MLRSPRSDRRDVVAQLGVERVRGSGDPTEKATEGLGRYDLLASAIAGQPVGVASVGVDEPAWTDGATVFIDAGGSPRSQVASLTVQASLLGAGSLDAAVLAPLVRRPALARRYLAIEGHRALSAGEHLLPRSVRALIDPSVARRTNSPSQSLGIARSREDIGDPPAVFGTIRPRRVEMTFARLGEQDSVSRHVPRRGGDVQLGADDVGDDDSCPDVDVFSSPIGGGGGIGKWLKRLFSEGRSPGGGPPGADSPTRWSRGGDRVARTVALSTAPIPEVAALVERQDATYPEWDVHKKQYKPDWCTVVEVQPTLTELAPFALPDTHALRRPLAPLGIDLERHRRQMQGDDIDVDAAVEARVELRAGSAPDEAVYIDSLRRRRDLSVLLLLDISGSAGEPSATGVPVHEHQRGVAAALTVALHDLGDRVALYGFRSQGRSAVQIVPVKCFGDDPDALVMERLGGLVPGAYTRLGAAIRHGTTVLEREGGTSRRLLVVLSDGLAYDHGYERAYGEADSRRALAEARRQGIGTLCLSVGAGTDVEVLRRIFGVAAHASLSRIEQLPAVVGPLFRAALRSAELQRRASQRRQRTKERLDVEEKTT